MEVIGFLRGFDTFTSISFLFFFEGKHLLPKSYFNIPTDDKRISLQKFLIFSDRTV